MLVDYLAFGALLALGGFSVRSMIRHRNQGRTPAVDGVDAGMFASGEGSMGHTGGSGDVSGGSFDGGAGFGDGGFGGGGGFDGGGSDGGGGGGHH